MDTATRGSFAWNWDASWLFGQASALPSVSRDACVSSLIVAVLVLTVVYLIVNQPFWKCRKLPPGPFYLPFLGNMIELLRAKQLFIYLDELGRRHGDIFTIRVGNRPVVILNSVSAFRETLSENSSQYAGRPAFFSGEIMSNGYQDITLGQYGPTWSYQRKLAHAGLRLFASGDNLESLIHREAGALMRMIEEQGCIPFDPLKGVTLFTYNVLCTICFQKTFTLNDPFFIRMSSMMDDINEGFGSGFITDAFPLYRFFPTPLMKKLAKRMTFLNSFMQDVYEQHAATTSNQGDSSDLLYHLLNVESDQKCNEPPGMTSNHYKNISLDLFVAGTDTTRFTIHWFIALLAAHPEIQRKMQQEIYTQIGPDEPVRLKHRRLLPYTEAVLQECIRLRPAAPTTLPHMTTADTTIRGFKIPKGTYVLGNIWGLHRDPNYWDDPEVFRPERFLNADGELNAKPGSYLPFSTGRRACPGETVARRMLLILVTMLVRRFTFHAASDTVKKLEMCHTGAMCMAQPYKVTATVNNHV